MLNGERRTKKMDKKCILLKSNIKHQNIGGKKAYIEKDLSIDDIIDIFGSCNIAVMNFIFRRPDLFDFIKEDMANDKARDKSMKYYYVKIAQPTSFGETYLGYVIASDEIEEE